MSNIDKKQALLSPCNGEIIKLEDVEDEVFSSGMLGMGFGIIPETKDFYSPVNGKITNAHQHGHAYMIETDDGLELLIHIGIDTVALEGECFSPVVKANMRVCQGDKLTYADVDRIRAKGFDPVVAVIITNSESVEHFKMNYGKATTGQAVMEYTLK